MGWVQKRTSVDGKARYRACYRDARDKIRTAGTFATKREAVAAAAEA